MYKTLKLFRIFRASLLIAGTTIGAGMLGIPLVTAGAGFGFAALITTLVWLFMLASGLYLLEATMASSSGSSFLSLTESYLGNKGKKVVGLLFLFLYYALMVAYFAVGAPLFIEVLGFKLPLIFSYLIFGLFFGAIVAIGPKSIDAVNVVLTCAMAVFWVLLIVSASSSVSTERLLVQNSSKMIFAMPVLFSAFGYHNIIPSLCSYMKKDRAVLRASIIIGTAIPFVVYLVWQWVIIGGVDQALIAKALKEGKPATEVLKEITAKPWIALLGKYFALLAISTSVLGVSFSILDFLKDGFNSFKMKASRAFLTFLVFFPPLAFCLYDPQIFDKALGIAGGIGEALLNGLIPVIFVYLLRYKMKRDFAHEIGGGKIAVALIAVISVFVMCVEIIELCSSCL